MKKQAYTLIGALVFATMFAFSTAKAQSPNQELIANVPFEFSAGNQTMPAGKYTVTVMNPTSDQKTLRIRGLNGKSALLQVHSVNGGTRENARLVFHRYGTQYFLAQAWPAADSIGMEAPRTKAERASELASNERKIETVALSRKK
ncbi:MAG TPA: hypothetical protein VN643_02975 [Pyrinomonadaceae bacterium]|nr:hypothetical protein [Pyrinomonadaceae bacterium]